MNNKGDRLVGQLSSGRWILTVLAGWAFFGFSIALAYVILKQRADFKPETLVAMFSSILLVIANVFKDYFHKNGDAGGDNGGENNESDNGGNGTNNNPTSKI